MQRIEKVLEGGSAQGNQKKKQKSPGPPLYVVGQKQRAQFGVVDGYEQLSLEKQFFKNNLQVQKEQSDNRSMGKPKNGDNSRNNAKQKKGITQHSQFQEL